MKEVICGIYKITSPVNKIYVGQSINIYKRWLSYKRLCCKSQRKIYNSLKKHGVQNHKFEIIIECKKEKLNELEKFYIHKHNCLNKDVGLNLLFSEENKEYNRLKKEKEELRKQKRRYYNKGLRLRKQKEYEEYQESDECKQDIEKIRAINK